MIVHVWESMPLARIPYRQAENSQLLMVLPSAFGGVGASTGSSFWSPFFSGAGEFKNTPTSKYVKVHWSTMIRPPCTSSPISLLAGHIVDVSEPSTARVSNRLSPP